MDYVVWNDVCLGPCCVTEDIICKREAGLEFLELQLPRSDVLLLCTAQMWAVTNFAQCDQVSQRKPSVSKDNEAVSKIPWTNWHSFSSRKQMAIQLFVDNGSREWMHIQTWQFFVAVLPFDWRSVTILCNSSYSALFWICDENSVDNTLIL